MSASRWQDTNSEPHIIPLVDLIAQYAAIGEQIDAAIQGVIEDASFIMGPQLEEFEQRFAEYCSAVFCVGVSSGTSALELALRALDVGTGDEVITVAHTFIATAEAISAVGAIPVFVDIDENTYTLDVSRIEGAITHRTAAIVPVHLYGQPADMTGIQAAADRHGLSVVADAAQAHGARWQQSRSIPLGDAGCFSFYPGKNLGAYGDAGAVVTDRADVAEKVRLLRNHGRRSKYVHECRGFGDRMDTLQAAILSAKLEYLDSWTEARNRLAHRYGRLLASLGLVLPTVAAEATSAWHLFVIRTAVREELLSCLTKNGVGAGVHYPVPLHLQPAYADLGYREGDLPVTEKVASTCLSLPLFPEMTHEQQDRVVSLVKSCLAQIEATR